MINEAGTVNIADVMRENRRHVGSQIHEARIAAGLTLRQLEEQCGVTYANLCRIERGGLNVQLDTLARILHVLELEIDIVKGS